MSDESEAKREDPGAESTGRVPERQDPDRIGHVGPNPCLASTPSVVGTTDVLLMRLPRKPCMEVPRVEVPRASLAQGSPVMSSMSGDDDLIGRDPLDLPVLPGDDRVAVPLMLDERVAHAEAHRSDHGRDVVHELRGRELPTQRVEVRVRPSRAEPAEAPDRSVRTDVSETYVIPA